MNIIINMTRAELESAWGACSSMDDNEHDKGVPDDAWQDNAIVGAINTLRSAFESREDNAPAPVSLTPDEFGLVCDAVEIYCTDPADDSDPERYAIDQALAARLLALGDISV